jgi:AraC-like DNA-binding protein
LQVIKRTRLSAARVLLVRDRATVSEAAYAVGYESVSHFSNDFKRLYGEPPSTVR